MKKRIKEIEEEAGALREMQAKDEKEMGADQGLFTTAHAFESLELGLEHVLLIMRLL